MLSEDFFAFRRTDGIQATDSNNVGRVQVQYAEAPNVIFCSEGEARFVHLCFCFYR